MEQSAKVLVVDDYEPNAKGMRDLLVAAGHSVRVAYNGIDALQVASEEPPDLIVLDVVMPGMSGVEVCRELKARSLTRLTPVVLVTGNSEHKYRLDGLEAGADDFIKKPISRSSVRESARFSA
jgi:two-component system cell cycle response regulator